LFGRVLNSKAEVEKRVVQGALGKPRPSNWTAKRLRLSNLKQSVFPRIPATPSGTCWLITTPHGLTSFCLFWPRSGFGFCDAILDGIKGQAFFQKRFGARECRDWFKTVPVDSEQSR